MRNRVIPALAFSLLLATPLLAQAQSPAIPPTAQNHIVSGSGLASAVTAQARTDADNRRLIGGVLQRADVQQAARRMGMNITKANDAVSQMTSDELARAAAPARAINSDLSGGDTIVFTTTTLLLLLILIVLIVK